MRDPRVTRRQGVEEEISSQLHRACEGFEQAWQANDPPDLVEHLNRAAPAGSPLRQRLAWELVLIDLERRWQRKVPDNTVDYSPVAPGQAVNRLPPWAAPGPKLEDYLTFLPELGTADQIPLEMIVAEYHLRHDWGDQPGHDEYLTRFPNQAADLRVRFEHINEGMSELGTIPYRSLRVRCPHCHNPIELVDDATDALGEIDCPSCGSNFSLVDHGTNTTRSMPTVKQFGHFELIEELGVGGFGSVWKARDKELDRAVAIKIPRKEQLERAEIEQFLREARAAAQLKHPNIVSVHEVGRQGDTVYIVSDLVRGVPLDEWLSGQQLTGLEAANLCAKVAEAVQHAHEAGVIHRDLKPGNILLDANNEPHVMDFGLAKREAGEITMTVEGRVLGTPAYMSPEQARGEGHQADRRTDVYSLGVILFQLLTGELPFRGTPRMLLHQVLNQEPRSPRTLNDRISRDLETITLKCLQKDPNRRYDSTRDLAEDLRRFVRGEPIQARPVGPVEKSFRWVKRNPVVAALSATAMALLGALATVGTVGYIQTARALSREEQARQTAQDNLVEANRQTKQAEENFRQSREIVETLLAELNEDDLRNQPGMELFRNRLLARARDYYLDFVQQHKHDPSLRAELASTYIDVGRTHESMNAVGESIAAYRHAVDLYEQLHAVDPSHSDYRRGLLHSKREYFDALSYRPESDSEEREELKRQALDLGRSLVADDPNEMENREALSDACVSYADFLASRGRREEARELYDENVRIREQLVDHDLDNEKYQLALATGLRLVGNAELDQGKLNAAEGSYTKSRTILKALLESDPHKPASRAQFAGVLLDMGRVYDAKENLVGCMAANEEAVACWQQLATQYPSVAWYRSGLSTAWNNLASSQHDAGEHRNALESIQQTINISQSLVDRFPDIGDYRDSLATNFNQQALIYRRLDDDEARLRAIEKSVAIREPLTEDFPDVVGYRGRLATGYGNLADAQLDLNQLEDALRSAKRACEIGEAVIADDPKNFYHQDIFVGSLRTLAKAQKALGHPGEAERSLRRSVEEAEKLNELSPGSPSAMNDLAWSWNDLGDLMRDEGNIEEARNCYTQAVQIASRLVELHADHHQYQFNVSYYFQDLLGLEQREERYVEAEQIAKKYVAFQEGMSSKYPDLPRHRTKLGWAHLYYGKTFQAMKQHVDAREQFQIAVELQKQVATETSLDLERNTLAKHLWWLATAEEDLGDYQAAASTLEQAVDILSELAPAPNSNSREELIGVATLLARIYYKLDNQEYIVLESMNCAAETERRERLFGLLHQFVQVWPEDTSYESTTKQQVEGRIKHLRLSLIDRNRALGNFARAAQLAREVVQETSQSDADNKGQLATALQQQGELLTLNGDFDEAEGLLQQAIGLHEETIDREHPIVVVGRGSLGACIAGAGRYEEAEPLLQESHQRLRLCFGDDDEQTVRARHRLIELYEAWEKPDRANELREQLTNAKVLPAASAASQFEPLIDRIWIRMSEWESPTWYFSTNNSAFFFQKDRQRYLQMGHRPQTLSLCVNSQGQVRYSGLWFRDNRPFVERTNCTPAEFQAVVDMIPDGYHPVSFDRCLLGEDAVWSGVWIRDSEVSRWQVSHGLSRDEFYKLQATFEEAGRRPHLIEAFVDSEGELKLETVWVEDDRPCRVEIGLTKQEAELLSSDNQPDWIPIWVDAYHGGENRRYVVILVERGKHVDWELQLGSSAGTEDSEYFEEMTGQGYRLVHTDMD